MTHSRRPLARVLSVLVVTAAACCYAGCANTVDTRTWVSRGEAAHYEAERRITTGDVDGARSTLKNAVNETPPRGTHADDARVVRQDLYYQLASLELEQNHTKDAAHWADLGLALGEKNDPFTANLRIARGKALEQGGDPNGATRDYHAALLITESLLEKNLGKE